MRQVAERVLAALAGSKRRIAIKPTRQDTDMILVARDLSPADVILFREHPFAAFVTDMGGATSHTAIIARSLAIPAIVALHHSRTMIREDELVIVDGTQGVLIVNPDRAVLAEYRLRQNQARLERDKLKRLKTAPAATLDGTIVQLHANIELPSDLDAVRASGAAGIGLFRSEFLFMNRRDLPDEDEQYEAYREVVEGMKGKPGHHPHARHRRRQGARRPGAARRRTRRWACAPSATASPSRSSSTRSCAPSCAPRATARR